MGFYLEDLQGIGAKHVEALVKDWYKSGLSANTMQNQLSKLRIFCDWLGKPRLIREGGVAAYLPEVDPAELKVKTYTERSKSLSGNGIDPLEVLARAQEMDERLCVMLMMGSLFGLRRKEMLMLKPHKADQGSHLALDGNITKGGRFRAHMFKGDDFEIVERKVIELAKAICKKDEALGWPGRTFKQNENRLAHYMRKLGLTKANCGVTLHGVRHELSENHALLDGLLPPVLGGTGEEMPTKQRKSIMQKISNTLGHGDTHTIGAYFGTFRNIREKAMQGHGTQIGSFVLCAERAIVGSLFVTPHVPSKPEGGFVHMDEYDKGNAKMVVVVEQDGVSQPPLQLSQFLLLRPEQRERAAALAARVGLELSC
jgi:site-specific recombinase XerC